MEQTDITHEPYEGFQRAAFDRWDPIMADSVYFTNAFMIGSIDREVLKQYAKPFTDLGYQIDLVDEHLALDDNGDGRGFITVSLHWKHTRQFNGLSPTGREGTSIETLLLTIRAGKITRLDVADNSYDLLLYQAGRGVPILHNVKLKPLVTGIDRSA
jgi:hypothetical protein